MGGAPVLGQADRAGQDLRRPGGDRDRERAPLQRDEGSTGPAQGLRRGTAGDLELGGGYEAGVREDPRELRTAVRGSARGHRPGRRRRRDASGRLPRTRSGGVRETLPGSAQRGIRLRGGDPAATRRPLPRRRGRRGCARVSAARNQDLGFQVDHPGADALGGSRHRRDLRRPRRRGRVLREGDRAAEDVRRPGGDRDPERAALQRDQGSARAADGDGGDPEGDQRIADGRAAGIRRDRQPCRPAGRRLLRQRLARRRRPAAPGGVHEHKPGGRRGAEERLPDRNRRGSSHCRGCPLEIRVLRRRLRGGPACEREGESGHARPWVPQHALCADSPWRCGLWGDARQSRRAGPIPRTMGESAQDLRRPGGDRDRERAPLQRDEGGARAADRDGRHPEGDERLADRRPAGVRRDREQRSPALPGRRRVTPRTERRSDRAGCVRGGARLRGERGLDERRVAARRSELRRPSGIASGIGSRPGHSGSGLGRRSLPDGQRAHGRACDRRGADAAREQGARRDRRDPCENGSVQRQGSGAAHDVRRPGGDRDRERPPLQRDKGSARPTQGLGRSAAGHFELRGRHETGVRQDSGELRAAVRGSGRRDQARGRGRHVAPRRRSGSEPARGQR